MTGPWLLFLTMVLATAVALARMVWRSRPRWRVTALAAIAVVFLISVGAAVAWDARLRRSAEARASFLKTVPRLGRPGGFVSSDACRACHPSEHASWYRSYHRTMTQYATPEAVRGRFEGVPPLRVRDGHLELERRGDEFWMTLVRGVGAAASRHEYRIGLVTGSHHLQVYWVPNGQGNAQDMVPYAYLLDDQRWVPARDTFLADPALEWRFDGWNNGCIQCHVTAGQPRSIGPGSDGRDSRAAELGIGCESCHGPGQAHVEANANPIRRYLVYFGGGRDPTIVNPAHLPPRASSEVCGQCHSVSGIPDAEDFMNQGFSYRPGERLEDTRPLLQPGHEPGARHLEAAAAADPAFVESRFWPDGMVRVSGREWNGLIRSPCHERGPITCLSCHSMHASDPADQLARDRESNEACLQCHGELRDRVSAHTRHAPDSEGSQCYNCHMPHTTYGLLKAIRSHQIDSPSVATTKATGRPNACNLCHLDRSLGWTSEHLTAWYGQPEVALSEEDRDVSAAVLWSLRGDAGQRALMAWSMGWPPARAASGEDWMPPFLTLALGDSYSAVRYIAQRSLRRFSGFEDLAYDYVAPPEQIERVIEESAIPRMAQRRRPLEPQKAARLLMRPDGSLRTSEVAAQVARRDERSMELKE
jgi:predicted CXXCH cytochrome family protein